MIFRRFRIPRICLSLLMLLLAATFSIAETDVTDLVEVNKSRVRFDRRASVSYLDVSVTNVSEEIYLTPIKVIVDTISSSAVTVANPDGYTDEDRPYIYITLGNNTSNELIPTETSESKKLLFNNPSRSRFSFTTSVLGSERAGSIIEQPTAAEAVEYDIGGEVTIPITTRKYVGSVELPAGFPVPFNKLFIESGIAGLTSISSLNLFKAEMNSDATALLSVLDETGKTYLMKLFPKTNQIREVNPKVNAESTAIALIALQAGIISTDPEIDAIILGLISNLKEIKELATQIEKELNQGIFHLDNTSLSNEVLKKCFEVHSVINNGTISDFLAFNVIEKTKYKLASYYDLLVPDVLAEWTNWDCTDADLDNLYDLDQLDSDGVCLSGTINSVDTESTFYLQNTLGRWAALAFETPDGIEVTDWVEPRNFSLPNLDDLLQEIVKLGYLEARDFFNKIFKDQEDETTLVDHLENIISSYIGNGVSSAQLTFTDSGEYNPIIVTAHLKGFSSSPYNFQIFNSLLMSATGEVIAPMASVILDFKKGVVNDSIRYSIDQPSCQKSFKDFFTPSVSQLSNLYSTSIDFGVVEASKQFIGDFLLDNFISTDGAATGVVALECLLKEAIGWREVRKKVIKKIKKYSLSGGVAVYIDAVNTGIDITNALFSTTLFAYSMFDATLEPVDRYAAIVPESTPDYPSSPTLLSPGSGPIDSTSINQFSWEYDADSYIDPEFCLTISARNNLTDQNDDSIVFTTCDSPLDYTTDEYYDLPADTLDPETDYTWAVTAIDLITGLETESQWWNFSTEPEYPTCTDDDDDGYYLESGCGTEQDCDDNDLDRSPGLDELCDDGIDNNCDGQIDEGCGYSTTTITLQPGFNEGKDTYYGTVYFQSGNPDSSSLRYGGWNDYYYNFIEFDLTTAPLASQIVKAELHLYSYNQPTYDADTKIDIITEFWDEASVTMYSNPSSLYYKQLGAINLGWNIVDITDLYKDWKNGTIQNYGIKLSPTSNHATNGSFYSSDYLDDPSLRPKLVIEFNSVPTVTSPTGQVWMDRNLGASRVATSLTDDEAYGDLYQWGRGTDGHEKRDSLTTNARSVDDIPDHNNFILGAFSSYDWKIQQNDNLWQGSSGINNPCPNGFRLPTYEELSYERATWDSSSAAFESPLKLIPTGYRRHYDGEIFINTYDTCWSSTLHYRLGQAMYLNLDSRKAGNNAKYRASGLSVRCIKD